MMATEIDIDPVIAERIDAAREEKKVSVNGKILPLCTCVCGASLDDAPSRGVWQMETIACEYRDCPTCMSTRAYMPADVIDGAIVSWISARETIVFVSLLDALETEPSRSEDVLIRQSSGSIVVLARTFCTPLGQLGWIVCRPEREEP